MNRLEIAGTIIMIGGMGLPAPWFILVAFIGMAMLLTSFFRRDINDHQG